MYTKTLTEPIDWLSEIDGMSVKEAIVYLQGLPQEYILNHYMMGDTYSVELVSDLEYTVPMTEDEIFAEREKRILKEIEHYEKAKVFYGLNPGNRYSPVGPSVANCEAKIAEHTAKLEALRKEYSR